MLSPDETDYNVIVPTADDQIVTVDRQLIAFLKGGDGVTIGHGTASATVIDNDGNWCMTCFVRVFCYVILCCYVTVVMVRFSVGDYEVLEGSSVELTVELLGETDIDIVVNMATQDLVAAGQC